MTHQMKPGVMVLKQTRMQGQVKVGVGNVHTLLDRPDGRILLYLLLECLCYVCTC